MRIRRGLSIYGDLRIRQANQTEPPTDFYGFHIRTVNTLIQHTFLTKKDMGYPVTSIVRSQWATVPTVSAVTI